jgi:hypothetical protein
MRPGQRFNGQSYEVKPLPDESLESYIPPLARGEYRGRS